ncbi:hypothetical protein DACRYDRAFT_22613 [Dacryopinax primogenitus]|uniref:Uncharacterized protein n=1 Tax=Dacryopinax primogenitus (strain DJM 731) TaxID=1858805 RepID=M5G012_DACPD|nr:uncharacterized protein DACRYDRAFT_22613 [Dacryopinax primogenitus]EJU01490.1 hypothetical protein DACRYDRAFT_22613 [Dacryopinax primogenitus]
MMCGLDADCVGCQGGGWGVPNEVGADARRVSCELRRWRTEDWDDNRIIGVGIGDVLMC